MLKLKNRNDIELIAVVDTAKKDFMARMMRQDFATSVIRHMAFIVQGKKHTFRHFHKTAKAFNTRVIPDNFDALISVACNYKLSKQITDNHYCVNYHNSFLPWYRGICSTQWEAYEQEPKHSYTWHKMNSEFDSGDILLQEQCLSWIPIIDYSDIIKIDTYKAKQAANMLPYILNCIVSKAEGFKQLDIPTYRGKTYMAETLYKNKQTQKCFGYTAFPEDYVPKIFRRLVCKKQ
jgi:methionyl-tRNA formyltransferase